MFPFGGVVLDVVVVEHHVVNLLGVDELGCKRQREADRHLVVDGNGGLPNLWHLEVAVYTTDGLGHGALFGRDGGRSSEQVTYLVGVGDEAAFELVECGVGALDSTVRVVSGNGIVGVLLYHAGVGGHIGKEHQRQTASKQARSAAHLQALVAEDVPYKAYTG